MSKGREGPAAGPPSSGTPLGHTGLPCGSFQATSGTAARKSPEGPAGHVGTWAWQPCPTRPCPCGLPFKVGSPVRLGGSQAQGSPGSVCPGPGLQPGPLGAGPGPGAWLLWQGRPPHPLGPGPKVQQARVSSTQGHHAGPAPPPGPPPTCAWPGATLFWEEPRVHRFCMNLFGQQRAGTHPTQNAQKGLGTWPRLPISGVTVAGVEKGGCGQWPRWGQRGAGWYSQKPMIRCPSDLWPRPAPGPRHGVALAPQSGLPHAGSGVSLGAARKASWLCPRPTWASHVSQLQPTSTSCCRRRTGTGLGWARPVSPAGA